MEEKNKNEEEIKKEETKNDILYHPDKDFYRGMGGELRYKAEGLFKKAKEKGISIETLEVEVMKNDQVEFPGIGVVELPTFFVKVSGKNIQTGQSIVDGKQMDYYNRYQMYVAERILGKNVLTDENGKILKENNRPVLKEEFESELSNKERFEIGRSLVEDKEFGLEKTITGGCDRIIRKLMGENDWLQRGEARLLDEEFEEVQQRIQNQREQKKDVNAPTHKKATERQINFAKSKLKNLGADPENQKIIREIIKHAGYKKETLQELNTAEVSRIIDEIPELLSKTREKAQIKNEYNH